MNDSERAERSGPITLWVRVPARIDTAARACAALQADARGAWAEPGNLKMELYRQPGEPATFYLYERWKSRNDLEAHFRQPYTQAAFDLAKDALESEIEMIDLDTLWPGDGAFVKQAHRVLATHVSRLELVAEPLEAVGRLKSLVEMARSSAGCVEFECHLLARNGASCVVYERWRDEPAADRFWSQPEVMAVEQSLAAMMAAPIRSQRMQLQDIT